MDRREAVTKFISKQARGIEIAPWHNPLAPKREGYACLILDRLDQAALQDLAVVDPYITPAQRALIEPVDLVGSAEEVDRLVEARREAGTFDYVLSSHNFEHLPNPLTFLRACCTVLKPGGVLSMAIPDRRGCWDYYRPATTTADVLDAYFSGRRQPLPRQVFLQESLHARLVKGAQEAFSFALDEDPRQIVPLRTLQVAFDDWHRVVQSGTQGPYRDTNCSAFTPASFELVLRDLRFLRLHDFDVLEVSSWAGEFHAHLINRRGLAASEETEDAFYVRRAELLLRALKEGGPPRTPGSTDTEAQLRLPAINDQHVAALAAKDQRLRELEAEVARLRTSKSWQLTRPLRIIAAVGRRLRVT